jgi:uncharacterized iron-regulated membrane protein
MGTGKGTVVGRQWPGHRTVWRWHFYAGLFCIPFVIWLAITGSIYLFKPQIEGWLDRPYDGLAVTGPRAMPSAHVAAALAAVPGSTLNSYELPTAPNGSVRVLVGRGPELYRAYVHPQTAAVINLAREDQRLMRKIFYLHGELMLGPRGSMLVELAASWAVVMLLTGLFLWWPRHGGLAGVVYPRMNNGGRAFWRDIHAVAGVWVTLYTLFLLTSGLPWAKSWGNLLKEARRVGGDAVARLDWTTGRDGEIAERIAMNTPPSDPDDHAAHDDSSATRPAGPDYSPIDRLVATVEPLHLAAPALISPPSKASRQWTARSDTPNRPQRVSLVLDGRSGAILSRSDFKDKPIIDRVIGVGIAAHEGQLFGPVNQLLGLANALGLIVVSLSAVVLWWGRRPASVIGAPAARPRAALPVVLLGVIAVLGVILPMLGLSLLVVTALERTVLRRLESTRTFLGLSEA